VGGSSPDELEELVWAKDELDIVVGELALPPLTDVDDVRILL
jgi:hypothetical protein